jgi:hypothetical protein
MAAAVATRGRRTAEHDVDRHALPPARSPRRARTLHRLRRRPRQGVVAKRIDIARYWIAAYPFRG